MILIKLTECNKFTNMSVEDCERVKQCYTHIVKYWPPDYYITLKQEFQTIQKEILDTETSLSVTCACGIIWTNSNFVSNKNRCCAM